MTTYIHFRELVEISTQETGALKYYNVKGVSLPSCVLYNVVRYMSEDMFWAFSARIGEEF